MRKIIPIIFLCLILCGCRSVERKKTIYAMDTVMDLTVYSENDEAIAAAEAEIHRIDELLGRSGENSEIRILNEKKEAVVSDETEELIKEAVSVSQKTDGAFDITTAPVTDLWGFYDGNFRVPSQNEIDAALESIGYEKIHIGQNKISIPENTMIDVGGIGKGYASDRVMDILKSNGVKSAIISLGGNVCTLGKRPDGRLWNVGICDPADKNRLIGTVQAENMAVITSGGYQRYFERDGVTYHHIIDPKTGRSAQNALSSVTVIDENGTLSDGLSTALFVKGLDGALEFWREDGGFDAVFVTSDGKIFVTEGIAQSFKSEREYEVCTR